nr:sialidase family protein [Saccharopolyspora gloriosae]
MTATAALALLAGPVAVAAPGGVDLAVSTDAVTYRIPALAVTERGTVIAAFDRRNDGPGDLPGDIDTMVRRSTDGGATWSEPRAVVDHPAPQGCGDPSLLTDRATGRVHLFCTFSHGEVGFQESEPGSADATDPRTVHVRHLTSSDDGRTWSAPIDLNEQVKAPEWAGIFASSGHGVQLSGGRLLQPIVVRDAAGEHHAANIYSDDHGETWRSGEPLAGGTDENKAVELSTGEVVQNVRDVDGGQRLRAVSEDGGITFGKPAAIPGLPDPGVNADVIRVDPRGSDERLLFSNPANSRDRTDLTVRISCDDGENWSDGTRLHPGPAAYSAMAMLPDGRVGVLAENGAAGAYEKLTFTALPLAEAGRCAG